VAYLKERKKRKQRDLEPVEKKCTEQQLLDLIEEVPWPDRIPLDQVGFRFSYAKDVDENRHAMEKAFFRASACS